MVAVRQHLKTQRDLATEREATLENIWKNAPRLTQEQLDRFITHHEYYVARQPRARRFIMRFVQLHTLSMKGRNLSEAELTGACLYACDLRDVDFRLANLYCADLRNADASRADFTRADLRGVAFGGSRLNGAKLDQADLRSAVVAVASEAEGIVTLRHRRAGRLDNSGPAIGHAGEVAQFAVDFTDASLAGARLEGASLKHANFTGAILTGARLAGAKLEGARLHGAVLTGVDIARLGLSSDQIRGAVVDPTEEAHSRAADMSRRLALAETWWTTGGAEGRPANLDGEDLRVVNGAFFKKALTGFSARNALALGVNFQGAMLQGAMFDDADLRGADFSGADLRGASFRGAKLAHARFDGADLGALKLAGGLERRVDFTGARGRGTAGFAAPQASVH
jgi:uncharacterized protein YjbI with pentapeptide repeats